MPNTEKVAAVAEIVDHFSTSSATVITEYRGLTVKQVSDLRRALGRDTTYAVVKNTLTKRAAAEAGEGFRAVGSEPLAATCRSENGPDRHK
jgi:large subunit ribosomal protein L10